MARLSIVIPTYKREKVLVDTVGMFMGQLSDDDELLVIDQTDEHTSIVHRALEQWNEAGAIRWIRHSPPSLTGARNRALLEATGDVILFIDDDVIPCAGFVEAHRRVYEDTRVQAVGGQVLQPKQAPIAHIPLFVLHDRRFGWLDFPKNSALKALGPVAQGCNFSVRRVAALTIGGFDERFYASGLREESDFLLRLHRTGAMVIFEPRASLMHLGAVAGGTMAEEGNYRAVRESIIACEVYFLLKNYGPVTGWYPFIRHGADFIRRRVFAGDVNGIVSPGNDAVREYPGVGLRGLPGAAARALVGVLKGIHMYLSGPMHLPKQSRITALNR